jgi:hypothetical protein
VSSSDPLTITVPDGYMWHGQLRHLFLVVVLSVVETNALSVSRPRRHNI